jgi:hypothetical protein
MSEVEFDRLLDAVRTAIAPLPGEELVARRSTADQPARAANDNQLAWPIIPFPDGWYASC